MARTITLKRLEIGPANYWYIKVWRLQVKVAAVSGGMDRNVFLFARGDPDPTTGEITDTFETVCTVADLSWWPANDPDPELADPYYRTDNVTLDFKSQVEFDWAWELFQSATLNLVVALNRADELVVSEDILISEVV